MSVRVLKRMASNRLCGSERAREAYFGKTWRIFSRQQ